MLICLTFCFVIASVMIMYVKKGKESFYLFGMCFSLMLEVLGIMIFIAKKGGVSSEVMTFLYFSPKIQHHFQYLLITLNTLGYMTALGKLLFPYFLIKLAMVYSMIPFIRKNSWITKVAAVFPALSLILYFPPIYRSLVMKGTAVQEGIAEGTQIWINLYLVISAVLLVYEFKSITMKFCRNQFSQIMISMFALSGLYYLYYRQDPGQIYHFYSYSFKWNSGLGYLQVKPSLLQYGIMVAASIVCCILGFGSLLRFTSGSYEESRQDVVMERKFDTAKIGASTFVHSMKNQLLSSRVIYKRIAQLYEQPEVDTAKVKEYVDALEQANCAMLTRMEELYRCVKSNAIYMVPVTMEEIAENTIERFHGKYPDAEIHVDIKENMVVLADKVHLCEALYNLLTNAQEAVLDADRGEKGEVSLLCYNERLYTVIEVRDNGNGMSKERMKRIFEPFYSSKNSNFNWGMGLYYVREIAKSHLGSLRVESREGEGSSFFILLPRYQ